MEAPDEVHGAVNGVDNENVLRLQVPLLLVFLAEKDRAGDRGGKPGHQQFLHPAVILRDHVPVAGLGLGQDAVGLKDQGGCLFLGSDDSI